MKKQLKNTISAYLCTIMFVVYVIGIVSLATGTPHTWQKVLVVLSGIGIMAVNLFLLE